MERIDVRTLVMVCSCALSACVVAPPGDAPDDGSSSSTGEASESSGPAAPASTSDAGDSTTTSETTGGSSICEPGHTRLLGQLGGDPIDLDSLTIGAAAMASTLRILFDGADILLHDLPDATVPEETAVTGLVRTPDGAFYCAAEGSTYQSTPDDANERVAQASLVGMAGIGACPGTPVEGSITICVGDCDVSPLVTSTIPGAAFEIPFEDILRIGDESATEVQLGFGSGGGFAVMHVTGDASAEQADLAIDGAYVIMPDESGDGTAVYCATGNVQIADYTPGTITLSSLGRVGSCKDAVGDGELELCQSW